MKATKRLTHPVKGNRGVAIVIVLSFVVLLTGLVVAFFTRTATQRQVSNAALNQNSVDLLAQNALSVITGDLREEIRLRSTSTVVTSPHPTDFPHEAVYYPTSAIDAAPRRSGNPAVTGTNPPVDPNPNLVRRSWVSDTNLDTDIPTPTTNSFRSRASASNSATASANGRKVNTLRWNAHGLIPPAPAATDLTPATTAFTAPDWVIVTKTGPKAFPAWDPTVKDSNNNNFATGRYAYAIYDEGGLLDINLAGYPSGTNGGMTTSTQYGGKPAVSYADLTQLGLTTVQVDNLVAWRNYGTAKGNNGTDSHTAFETAVVQNTSGFLKVPEQQHNNRTDQAFTNRQALLKFWKDKGLPLNTLQYFATFSRGLNQPSYRHESTEPNRPAVAGINPDILSVRDNVNGLLPLIRQRFPLSRLAWLTSEGPSAALGTSGTEGAIRTLLTAPSPSGYGLSTDFLAEGTADNILLHFGLEWSTTTRQWEYVHAISGGIATLSEVASFPVVNKRSPNFFELLKAGVNSNAMGISFTGTPSAAADAIKDNQIFQIGANIIDQSDVDSFPIVINTGGATRIYGVENLPYLYRVRNTLVRATRPSPDPAQGDAVQEIAYNPANPITQGEAFVLLQPEVWNPHRATSNVLTTFAFNNGLTPTKFRFRADSSMVVELAATAYNGESSTGAKIPIVNSQESIPLTSSYSYLDFAITNSVVANTDFREPTLLKYATSPGAPTMEGDVFDSASTRRIKAYQAGVPDINDAADPYVGIYLGTVPLRWVWEDNTNNDVIISAEKISATVTSPGNVEFVLEYEDTTGATAVWRPYDTKLSPDDIISPTGIQSLGTWPAQGGSVANPTDNTESWATAIDPRTSRFGMFAGRSIAPTAPIVTGSTSKADQSEPETAPGIDVSALFSSLTFPTTWAKGGTGTWLGFLQQNIHGSSGNYLYYQDLDGVVRRAANAVSDAAGDGRSMKANNEKARPVVLNRPFRSVAELGYAFADTPWKNVDMSTNESAHAALLDLFCINENADDKDGLVAGKVNLNTRQYRVLQSVLAGAYIRDAFVMGGGIVPPTEMDTAIAENVALELYKRTNVTSPVEPLSNLAELVGGKWITGSTVTAPIDGKSVYSGFSKALDNAAVYPVNFDLLRYIPNYKESSIRALANVGQTRVWNLFIDIIAQKGRYPLTATTLDGFNVDAERRYWVHIAIDRATGKVIDQQIEIVKE